MKRAAILALFVAAAATADESPERAALIEMEPGQAAVFRCAAEGGCVVMSKQLLESMLEKAANVGRASCKPTI